MTAGDLITLTESTPATAFDPKGMHSYPAFEIALDLESLEHGITYDYRYEA